MGTSKISEDVLEFHRTYGLSERLFPRGGIPEAAVREKMLTEELDEYKEAVEAKDVIEIADALADMVYLAYGDALCYGIDLDAVLAEVHRSNMSKLDADGKPIFREDGKVLKGPNYFKPDLKKVMYGE